MPLSYKKVEQEVVTMAEAEADFDHHLFDQHTDLPCRLLIEVGEAI
jgi:hypothetical protein